MADAGVPALATGSPLLPKSIVTRHRSNVHQSVQTEASFVPSMVDLKLVYEPQASEQFTQLFQLRALIQRCMQEVVGSVYDVVSFKDVMFKMEEEFPTNLPVTDMLMLSSKLFRTASELGRLLGCFFGVVFADDHADEHFHFAEIRILQRELKEVKAQLKDAEEEKIRLQQMLDNVGQVALDHGKAVELLENHNQALQLQTNALEDQMALLFRQLNTDLEVNCKDAYEKATMEMEIQERLNPTRTTFRQTMDSLSQQIRSSRTLISEVREALMGCSQGSRTGEAYLAVEPSVRFKLKMLDSNFQQLVGRFNAVKDTVVETAQELMTALHERKRILYLSFQHIRLYDLQNAKLRAGKAVLSELSNYTNDLLQRMQATFPAGAITSVDRIGRITTQRWHGGYTLAALRQRKAAAAAANRTGSLGDGTGAGGGAGGAGMPTGASGVLPGLTEVEMMAAESELAAFEEANGFGAAEGGHGGVAGSAGVGGVGAVHLRPAVQTGGVPSLPLTPQQAASSAAGGTVGDGVGNVGGDAERVGDGGVGVDGATTAAVLPPTIGSTTAPVGHAASAVSAVLFDDMSKTNAMPFNNVFDLLELARLIDADISKLNGALTLDDEVSAFLKTLTLSVTSTARGDVGLDGTMFSTLPGGAATLEKMEGNFERALMPTGGLTSYRQRNSIDSLIEREREKAGESDADSLDNDAPPHKGKRGGKSGADRDGKGDDSGSAVTKAEQAHAEALLARQAQQLQRKQEQLNKMQDDFSSKLGFLRQVYEARITDLEVKETTLKKKFIGNAPSSASGAAVSAAGGVGVSGAGGSSSPHSDEAPVGEGSGKDIGAGGGSGGGAQTPSRAGGSALTPPTSGRQKGRGASSGGKAKEAEFALVRDVNIPKGNDEEMAQLRSKTDREELLAMRGEWRKSRQTLLTGQKMREATVAEIDRVEHRVEAKKAKKRSEMTRDKHPE